VCTVAGGECCNGLSCLANDSMEGLVLCGDPNAVTGCFCGLENQCPLHPALAEPCSVLVPCCEGYCADAAGADCTSTDLSLCSCQPIG